MPLKIKGAVDRAEEERAREEAREKAGAEHFKDRGLSTPWKLAPVVANVADAVSTQVMRKKLGEDFREVNPLGRALVKKPALSIAAKAAFGVGASLAAQKFAKKYGKTAGKIISAAGSATPAVATVNNVVRTIKYKKK